MGSWTKVQIHFVLYARGRIAEQSSPGLSEWDEKGSEDSVSTWGERSPAAFPVWIFNWPSCVFAALQGESKDIKLLKRQFPLGSVERRPVAAFILPSKPTCLVAHSNGVVSRTIQSSVCAQVSQALRGACVPCGGCLPWVCRLLFDRRSSVKASDVLTH